MVTEVSLDLFQLMNKEATIFMIYGSVGILECAAEILGENEKWEEAEPELWFFRRTKQRRGDWAELIFLHLYSLYLYTITMND